VSAVSISPRSSVGIGRAVLDGLLVTERNLINYRRIPEALFFSSVQPIMFVLLFRYAFGGAIKDTGGPYVDYLMAGIFLQTVSFGSISTAVGLAEDLHRGLIERFRSLPMARSAVLAGRTTADLVRNVFVVLLMLGVGYAVGFRVHTNFFAAAGGLALVLLFAYALSWGFATVGLSAPNAETAQLMAFPVLFPLVFASGAFVPVQTMPGWLQAFARHQPLNLVVSAVRALTEGGPTSNYVLQAVLWCLGLLVVFAPLSVWKYRRIA
jgi:ABC transporter DrrB family efflux protein